METGNMAKEISSAICVTCVFLDFLLGSLQLKLKTYCQVSANISLRNLEDCLIQFYLTVCSFEYS